jgi:hypothetical protein
MAFVKKVGLGILLTSYLLVIFLFLRAGLAGGKITLDVNRYHEAPVEAIIILVSIPFVILFIKDLYDAKLIVISNQYLFILGALAVVSLLVFRGWVRFILPVLFVALKGLEVGRHGISRIQKNKR